MWDRGSRKSVNTNTIHYTFLTLQTILLSLTFICYFMQGEFIHCFCSLNFHSLSVSRLHPTLTFSVFHFIQSIHPIFKHLFMVLSTFILCMIKHTSWFLIIYIFCSIGIHLSLINLSIHLLLFSPHTPHSTYFYQSIKSLFIDQQIKH